MTGPVRRFEGKTAIVTGASRGIGLGIAERLVAEGAKVVITARNAEALDEAVAALGGPDVALAVAGRSDDADHRAETVERAVATFGGLDFLVNNTGHQPGRRPAARPRPRRRRARSPRPTSSRPWPGPSSR